MGTDSSKTIPPNHGEPSSFYCACRNGDIATVRNMLPKLTYEQANQIEPNGSTALHAACFHNQPQIVRLLLENGCSRTTVDSNGATAYQVAATDEIRALFQRPPSNRFVDDCVTDSFKLVPSNGTDALDDDDFPDDLVKGYISAADAHEATFMISMATTSNPLQRIVRRRIQAESIQSVGELLSRSVPKTASDFGAMMTLFKDFKDKKDVSNLLTMYTHETDFFRNLRNEPDSFTVLLYFHLNELQSRAYQGESHRGALMTKNDIDAYRWAERRKGYVLETRTLQSTSKKQSVAEVFIHMNLGKRPGTYPVMLELNFHEKCPTAIDLTEISDKLPCVSAVPPEEEVLLLPYTLFTVEKLKRDPKTDFYYITLKNVPTPIVSLYSAVKNMKEKA